MRVRLREELRTRYLVSPAIGSTAINASTATAPHLFIEVRAGTPTKCAFAGYNAFDGPLLTPTLRAPAIHKKH